MRTRSTLSFICLVIAPRVRSYSAISALDALRRAMDARQ